MSNPQIEMMPITSLAAYDMSLFPVQVLHSLQRNKQAGHATQ